MSNKIIFFLISGVILIVVIFFGAYKITHLNKVTNIDNLNSITNSETSPDSFTAQKKTPQINYLQFRTTNPSSKYADLLTTFSTLIQKSSSASSANLYSEYQNFYDQAFGFAYDNTNDTKERAYTLDMVNMIYIQGFDHNSLFNSIKNNKELLDVYNKNLAQIKKYKKVKENVSGIMFNNGSSDTNYALQKTMQFIDDKSYSIYPNIYAVLRSSLNYNQANGLLYYNYKLDKNYKSYNDFLNSKYYDGYIENYGPKIEKLKSQGNFYTDLAASSYEADIMYSEFLFIKYGRTKNDSDKIAIAKSILDLADEMEKVSDKYNTSGNLFYGYFWANANRVRVAQLNILSNDENDKAMRNAVSGMEKLVNTNKNVQMSYWFGNLSINSVPYQALLQISKQSDIVKKYLEQVRK